jgi:UDP:flavonoid glycosyltransferase YjiC (YdhE family)
MRIAILAWGTRGDVQPMLAVADELARRGHSVVLTVNPNLVAWARRSGQDIVPIEPDLDGWFRSPEGRTVLARADMGTLTRETNARERRSNPQIIEACREAGKGADLIVSAIMTCYRGRCLAEHQRVPDGILCTFPVHPTAAWSYVIWPLRHMGLGALNRATYGLVYGLWWKAAKPNVDDMRAALGLAPARARLDVEHDPCALVFSPELVPRPKEWPDQVQMTGFVTPTRELRERLGEATLSDGLEPWLDDGEAPVYFGFGSMPVLDPAAMLGHIAEVTARRGVRGLIGAGWTDYGATGGALPKHLFVAPAFDHDRVLPRCRAAVHHGGAGTTGAVLRAGLPALVASVFADQPYWGWRVRQQGVGYHVPFRKLDARAIDRAFDRLLDARVREKARGLAARLQAENGAARAADLVLGWARHAAPARIAA